MTTHPTAIFLSRWASRHLPVVSLLMLLAPIAAGAQTRSGTIAVVVGSKTADTQPLRIFVAVTTPDAAGRLVRVDSVDDRRTMTMTNIPSGHYRVETRVIGYVPDTMFIEVTDGGTAALAVELQKISALAAVRIASTSHGHMSAFEKRRAQGKGTFLTRTDIERQGQNQVSMVLRSVRGIRVECQTNCRVHMVRSTTCEPRYYVNGFPTDAAVLLTPVLDVAGIEVYRGPSETPGEFLGAQSMCGAIIIWTK